MNKLVGTLLKIDNRSTWSTSLFAKHIKHELAWDQTWPLW